MENKQPLLSICIPTYNRVEHISSLLKFLYKEYESLSFEKKKMCEILVRDNCSTDDTERCVTEFLLSRKFATYCRNSTNVGATNNFLLLSQNAKGEYVWWLGDDDELKTGIVEKILNSLLIYKPAMLFINHGRRAKKNAPFIIASAVDEKKTDFYEDGRQAIADIIGFGDVGNVLFMSAKVVRTVLLLDACKDIKLPNGSLPLYIAFFAASKGSVAIIKEPMMENIIGEISWRDRAALIALEQIPATIGKLKKMGYSSNQFQIVKRSYFSNKVKVKILLYKLKLYPFIKKVYDNLKLLSKRI
jgi:glycosyltransferase involved in cell wall biosynthesis